MNLSRFVPIIVECHQGQKKKGIKLGGKYLYDHIFYKKNNHDIITIPKQKFNTELGYKELYNICSTLQFPLVLGGNHSIGTSTVLGSVKKYRDNLTVVWIDAHADINTMESSLSKNKHGMPVAFATGLDRCWFDKLLNIKLNFEKIIYVGIRDLDQYEKEILVKHNIKHYTVDETMNFINSTKDSIHISFDVDSLEPNDLDSTGTIASYGLNYVDVKNIINASLTNKNLVCLDIVEFNPELGDVNKLLETMKYIFL